MKDGELIMIVGREQTGKSVFQETDNDQTQVLGFGDWVPDFILKPAKKAA